jgi:hypothetical protein
MHKRNKKPPCRKIVMKLPDLDHAKSAVLNSLSSPHSRRNYKCELSAGVRARVNYSELSPLQSANAAAVLCGLRCDKIVPRG